MKENRTQKLTRREFAEALAAAVAAPALFAAPAAAAQEKKEEPPKAPPPSPEEARARARKALREFALPEGSEPAFVFRAR